MIRLVVIAGTVLVAGFAVAEIAAYVVRIARAFGTAAGVQ